MNREDIIKMADASGLSFYGMGKDREQFIGYLECFADLVSSAERKKSLQLWMLLDDIDTADDIAKADDAVYRSLCRQAHQKRWAVLTTDEVDAAIRARGQV